MENEKDAEDSVDESLEKEEYRKSISESAKKHSELLPQEIYEESFDDYAQDLLFGAGWDFSPGDRFKVVKRLTVVTELPMTCKVKECPYYQKCGIMRGLEEGEQNKLEGTICREEREFAIRLFASLVRDLKISATDTTDILMALSLTRHHVMKRRLDWQIGIDGATINSPVAVDLRTNIVLSKPESHPLHKEVERLEKLINALYSQLLASRKEKAQVNNQQSKVFEQLLSTLQSRQKKVDKLPPSDIEKEE